MPSGPKKQQLALELAEPVAETRSPPSRSPPPPRRPRVAQLGPQATLPPVAEGIVLRVCRGHTCGKRAGEIQQAIADHVREKGLEGLVGLAEQSCYGKCFLGPNLLVERHHGGQRDERALVRLMIGMPTPELRYENSVVTAEIPKIIRWHLRSWRKDRDEPG